MKNNNGCDLCFKDLTDQVVIVKEGKFLCEGCKHVNEELMPIEMNKLLKTERYQAVCRCCPSLINNTYATYLKEASKHFEETLQNHEANKIFGRRFHRTIHVTKVR